MLLKHREPGPVRQIHSITTVKAKAFGISCIIFLGPMYLKKKKETKCRISFKSS